MRISENHSYMAQVSFERSGPTLERQSSARMPLDGADSVNSVSANAASAREAKVAELGKQYQAGKYKVDATEVSSKIVERHLKT